MNAYRPDDLLRRGAAHVIAKPFELDELANILRLLTKRDRDECSSGGAGQE